MRGLWSTAGAAALLCVLGCALVFFPWCSASVMYFDPTLQADGTYKAKALPSIEEAPGYGLWQGVGSAAAFLGILVFLVITGPLRPVPWWRSVAVLAGGAAIAGAVLLGMRHPPRSFESDLQAGRVFSDVSWDPANYGALGLAVALVLVAAVELRQSVARGRDRQGQGAVGPAAGGPGGSRSGSRSDEESRPRPD
jgi:hypothetical protein